MIISIRGTSGSGKSTLVRKVMECYHYKVPQFIAGRKQPISYNLYDDEGSQHLTVIGHYESPCGGCDTIHEFDDVFRLVRKAHEEGSHVLFEGVLLYCEVPRTIALAGEFPVTIIALNTPIDVCVESINLRRAEKSILSEPVDPENTITKFNGTVTTMARLEELGVPVNWCSRDEALQLTLEKLGLQGASLLL